MLADGIPVDVMPSLAKNIHDTHLRNGRIIERVIQTSPIVWVQFPEQFPKLAD
jgi:hypothetical protein